MISNNFRISVELDAKYVGFKHSTDRIQITTKTRAWRGTDFFPNDRMLALSSK